MTESGWRNEHQLQETIELKFFHKNSMCLFFQKFLNALSTFECLSIWSRTQNNLHHPNQSCFKAKAAHSTESVLVAIIEKHHAARSALEWKSWLLTRRDVHIVWHGRDPPASCWCPTGVPQSSVLLSQWGHMGFLSPATPMTFNSSSPLIPQTLRFLLRSQQICQEFHHGSQLISWNHSETELLVIQADESTW